MVTLMMRRNLQSGCKIKPLALVGIIVIELRRTAGKGGISIENVMMLGPQSHWLNVEPMCLVVILIKAGEK